MTTDAWPALFWITSRAAGSAALVLASLAVCLGLLMSTRLRKRVGGPDLRVAHEALSLATIVAIAVHGLALLGDRFLHPSFADITVPFVSGYKTGGRRWGSSAAGRSPLLGLSYYARARIGQQRWRKLHRFTALAWLLGSGPHARRGHGRRPDVVPRDDRHRRRPGARPAAVADERSGHAGPRGAAAVVEARS